MVCARSRRRLLSMTVLAIVIAGCADHLVGPGPDEPTAPAPQMALVPDAGTARGPLIAEFTIVVPDSGTAEGELILWTPGEMDTTAILEITTDLTLDNRPIPVSETVYPGGVIAYYRSDGELVRRSVDVILFEVSPGGRLQLRPLAAPETATSVAVLDPDAPNHGFLVTWSVSEEVPVGYNINDGGPPPNCVLMISWLCYASPDYRPENVSDTPPHGTIQVRVFAAGAPECPPDAFFDAEFLNSMAVLWDLSYPDASFADRRERMGFIVERNGSFDFEFFPVTSDPCNILDVEITRDYDLLPDNVVGWVHTHPGKLPVEVVPPGGCKNVPAGARLESGPSVGDLNYIEFLERTYGREIVGIIIEPDGVIRFGSSNPAGTKYANCLVTQRSR